ncbi:MAG: hypothetical protein FD170_3783 [Bacteroidetes bacterium]|nr:MAG: hypothetical protein FD170_3783 [Bacteroidota bacterium]
MKTFRNLKAIYSVFKQQFIFMSMIPRLIFTVFR